MTCADERFYLVSSQLGADSPFFDMPWKEMGTIWERFGNILGNLPHVKKMRFS